jgi:Divergent InlB B-repeat domain/NHL repeat
MRLRWPFCLAAFAFAPVLCQAQGFVTTGASTGASQNHHSAEARDGVFKIDVDGARSRAVDAAGDIYFSDSGNNRVQRIDEATGIITMVAGNGVRGFAGDGGPATDAELDGPTGLAVDLAGNLYIADGTRDGHMRIRRVTPGGVITTVAGNGSQGYSGDGGPATSAQFKSLGGMATDAAGNLYLADNYNNRIRMVSAATGIITTVAGNGAAGHAGDGDSALSAELNNPLGVAVDAAGNLNIADSGNYRIREVTAASGMIGTLADNGQGLVYRDTQHGYPCALSIDAQGNLYIADSGTARIRKVAPDGVRQVASGDTLTLGFSQANTGGFHINVTYGNTVPAAAQTAFNSLVSTYESVFTTPITVNIDVNFGTTGLGASFTQQVNEPYSSWRTNMLANATANPGNTWNVAAAASLPANGDPIGNGSVTLNSANARALGFTANVAVDSTLTFSNKVAFEYTGVANSQDEDFLDVAAHELDEALGIGSALTGLANNASIPSSDYTAEDYFRFSAAATRGITTNPTAVVYFSYDGGITEVAQFNQAYSALGDSDLDRNDWVYGDAGCPAATPHVQDAILCYGQAVAVGSGPEIIVLNSLGYNSTPPSYQLTVNETGQGSVTSLDSKIGCVDGAGTCSASYVSGTPVTLNATAASGYTFSGWSGACTGGNPCVLTMNQILTATATFTLITGPPAIVSLSPTSGAGTSVTFKAVYSDPYGTVDLSTLLLQINASQSSANACYVYYQPQGNHLYLASNAGVWITPALTPGVTGTASNSQCTLNAGSSSVTTAGNNMTLNVALSFNSSFTGAKNVYLYAAGLKGQNSGWVKEGTWTPNPILGPPAIVSLSPSSGSGTSVTLKAVYSDPAGTADLDELLMQINASQSSANACYVYYQPQGNHLYLASNAGVWITPALTPGVTGTASNSQCTLNAGSSSVTTAGNNLTLNVALTFNGSFMGAKNVYLYAAGLKGQTSGWVKEGTWTPNLVAGPPAIVSLSPNPAGGTAVTLKAVISDPNGAADLNEILLQINTTQSSGGACYVYYQPKANLLYLYNGTGWMTPGLTPGTAGTASNSQCTLNGGSSSVTAAGNNLTVNVALSSSGAFVGAKNVYLYAAGLSGQTSGWVKEGTWTP